MKAKVSKGKTCVNKEVGNGERYHEKVGSGRGWGRWLLFREESRVYGGRGKGGDCLVTWKGCEGWRNMEWKRNLKVYK